MAALSRFQMDLTPEELDSIERWSARASSETVYSTTFERSGAAIAVSSMAI